ncbi:MAG: NAD-dependent epimerase/dehydratase family protein [Opitutaceae bacterium]
MDAGSGGGVFIVGCGYLGQAVARRLRARGIPVAALTRNPETAAALEGAGVETLVAELSGTEWHARVPGGITAVVNCVSAGGGGLEGYRRSYVEGMRSLLAWARTQPSLHTVAYTGSTSVYPGSGGALIDESAPVGGGERARLLLEAEGLLLGAPAAFRAFVLRLAGIYGPGRDHLARQVRAGAVSGRPDVHLNLIHRDDAAAGVEAALLAPSAMPGGIYNLADDGAATRGAVATWLASRLGVPQPVFTGEEGPRREGPAPDRIISNRRARERLGWQPRYPNFRDGYAGFVSP